MTVKKEIFKELKKEFLDVKENVLLSEFTTFKIGGPAKYFLIVKDKEALKKAVILAKKNKLDIFVLGGGSNLLVSDKGFNGLVIKFQVLGFKLLGENKIFSQAGTSFGTLVGFSSLNSLAGLDWGAGIPGTIGGAIYGNAQAFGKRISDNLLEVECFDTKTLKTKKFFF